MDQPPPQRQFPYAGWINALVRLLVHGPALAFLLWGPLDFGKRMAIYVAFFLLYMGLAGGTTLGKWM